MSLLPAYRQIQQSDAPETSPRLLRILNSFFQAIYSLVNGNLSVLNNLNTRYHSLEFTSAALPLLIPLDNKLPTIKGLIVCQVIGELSAAPHVKWQQVGNSVQLTEITGLLPGNSYTFKLLLF